MTVVDRKRFIWILIAIVFFFANLIVMAVLVINSFVPRHGPAAPATQMAAPAGS